MSTDEASCSDCKMEIIDRKWAQLLLNWINRCGNLKNKVVQLENWALTEVLNKYRDDVGSDDLDYDVEHLVRRRYPILRLRYLSEDIPKRLYMMSSILLFHCCTKSQSGSVDSDIFRKMSKFDQEWILKFCENLSEMETTINNVDSAIREAYEFVSSTLKQSSTVTSARTDKNTALEADPKDIDSDAAAIETDQPAKYPGPILKFKSSITVMPSVVTDTSSKSSESDYDPCSGDNRDDLAEDVTIFNLENFQQSDSRNAKKLEKDSSEIRRTCKPGCACIRCSASGPCCGDPGSSLMCYKVSKVTKKKASFFRKLFHPKRKGSKGTKKASFFRPLFNPKQCPKRMTKSESQPCSELCSRKISEQSSEETSGHGSRRGSRPGSKQSSREGSEEKFRKELHKKLNQAMARRRSQHQWSEYFHFNWRMYICCAVSIFGLSLVVLLAAVPYSFLVNSGETSKSKNETNQTKRFAEEIGMFIPTTAWICEKNLCQKVYHAKKKNLYFTSLSRCTLLCMRPQIWPHPIGYTYFSKEIVALATNKLEYRFQSVPSDPVHHFLAEAFKLFLGDLVRLERIDMPNKKRAEDLTVKKMSIQIDIETDPDPRLRLNTEESYTLKIETLPKIVVIKIASASFCGVRHGLETLSQVILLDQSTGYLITLSNILVKDAPSYKYRGLMIDTARNYIPVPDLMRTIDAMATCKLNTFHWRITDVTSFPLYLQEYPFLFEYGAYDKSMIYTEDHITAIVHRAGIRGIRVVIEVASPGPVGRAWSWSPDANCQKKNDNYTCDNILCLRLKMRDSVFDILQMIYAKIIDLTKVEDVFHLSNGIFSLSNCYYLIDDRQGFLDKALERLKLANKGFLPTLPLIWYTTHLTRNRESRIWDRLGVQLSEWLHITEDHFLSRFRAVHSSRWDLSCEIKKQRCMKYRTWQEMYAWKAWRNLEVFTIEGGEAMLWTDLVDSGNLDYHLWPRAAAVAERLWSDIATNATANCYTYARLDAHRWRMLLRGIRVQPIWPVYCSFNPTSCSHKIKN